jgi:HNH endonuclease
LGEKPVHDANPAKHDRIRYEQNRHNQNAETRNAQNRTRAASRQLPAPSQQRETSNDQNCEDIGGNHDQPADTGRRRRGTRRLLADASGERDFNELSKEEIIALVRKVAEELGHRPNQFEFWQAAKAKKEDIRRMFGSYRELVQEAGFEALGPGYYLTTDQLLADWAAVARKLGKTPTVMQYNKTGKYSHRAFRVRWKSWHDVPTAMMAWAAEKWPDRQWDDVMEIARKCAKERKKAGWKSGRKKYNRLTSTEDAGLTSTPKKSAGAVYGRPIMMQELATAPTNEAGVIFLFGALARQLGFMVLRVQQGFPDVEALRRAADGVWRWVRIELEFESRNFLLHGHDPKGCDLIVCWTHNWPSCPVEVVELSKIIG